MRLWAILGDLRENWDFQALRFNAILGDLPPQSRPKTEPKIAWKIGKGVLCTI
jgi:hypothetical protein